MINQVSGQIEWEKAIKVRSFMNRITIRGINPGADIKHTKIINLGFDKARVFVCPIKVQKRQNFCNHRK